MSEPIVRVRLCLEDILRGRVPLFDGVEALLRFAAQVPALLDDRDVARLAGILAEAEHLPIGPARALERGGAGAPRSGADGARAQASRAGPLLLSALAGDAIALSAGVARAAGGPRVLLHARGAAGRGTLRLP